MTFNTGTQMEAGSEHFTNWAHEVLAGTDCELRWGDWEGTMTAAVAAREH